MAVSQRIKFAFDRTYPITYEIGPPHFTVVEGARESPRPMPFTA